VFQSIAKALPLLLREAGLLVSSDTEAWGQFRFTSEKESLDYEDVVKEHFETVFACCFKISTEKTKLPLGYLVASCIH